MGGSDCSSPLMISEHTWAKLYISWEVFTQLIQQRTRFIHKTVSSSSGDSMARPVSFQTDDETVGLKGIIKTEEYVKIITRALYSLGFKKTATLLEEESGIPLHSSSVTLFMQQVVDGKWDEGLAALHNIGLLDEKMVTSAYFLIL